MNVAYGRRAAGGARKLPLAGFLAGERIVLEISDGCPWQESRDGA